MRNGKESMAPPATLPPRGDCRSALFQIPYLRGNSRVYTCVLLRSILLSLLDERHTILYGNSFSQAHPPRIDIDMLRCFVFDGKRSTESEASRGTEQARRHH